MSERVPEVSGSQIVLVGSFNPKIFQPEWFGRHNLLAQEQVDSAEIKIIIPQISHFETDDIILQVTNDKFVAASKPSSHPLPLSDLVRGTFFLLEHTPVNGMGLNRQMHFSLETAEAWHKVGDKLAPKEPWNTTLEGHVGLLSLSITTSRGEKIGGWREDKYPGARYTVRVEPSVRVKFGVYFETNEHYPAPETEPLKALMRILGERWEDVPIRASRVANYALDWATGNA